MDRIQESEKKNRKYLNRELARREAFRFGCGTGHSGIIRQSVYFEGNDHAESSCGGWVVVERGADGGVPNAATAESDGGCAGECVSKAVY